MEEIWKNVVGYEGLYQISSLGRVRRVGGKILKSTRFSKGYFHVNLCCNGKYKSKQIHRLVAQAFIPNPNNLPIVNHKDENPSNNTVENLEWCTVSYNLGYGTANKRREETILRRNSMEVAQKKSSERNRPKARRAVVRLDCNGNYIDEFPSISDAQKKTQCWNISRICRGLRPQNGNYVWLYLKDYKQ